jgi:hypothetical protein
MVLKNDGVSREIWYIFSHLQVLPGDLAKGDLFDLGRELITGQQKDKY